MLCEAPCSLLVMSYHAECCLRRENVEKHRDFRHTGFDWDGQWGGEYSREEHTMILGVPGVSIIFADQSK